MVPGILLIVQLILFTTSAENLALWRLFIIAKAKQILPMLTGVHVGTCIFKIKTSRWNFWNYIYKTVAK